MNSKRGKIKTYLIELTIVTIGVLIALFLSNLKEYDQALEAFTQAKSFDSTVKTAKQWVNYVTKEKQYKERLAMVNH